MKRLPSILILILFAGTTYGQSAASYAVHVQAAVETNPVSVKLTWNSDGNATAYNIYRKLPHEPTFGTSVVTLSGADTAYSDTSVEIGVEYEYQVRKSASGYNGYGYCNAGIEVRRESLERNALIIVESNLYSSLEAEVDQTMDDLAADGWMVEILDVSKDTSVSYVKELIEDHFTGLDGDGLIYIIGHVPVPYSGNLYPDAHTNHIGAWPADVFYAELDGTWTDQSVNNSSASDPRNHNVPGDGKLDESELPSDVDLMIGRVDFANLTVFSQDEIELTKRYLDRVHHYKQGEWTLEKRALIDDNFGGFNGEAFAANGWRNFSPLVGRDNVFPADYRSEMATNGYLFSYGCGGGTFTSAGGIGNSTQLATDSLLTGFTMLFGSYFGDWDRTNNFMRSALAQGRTMSISWAGRPNWAYHPMATGHCLGYSARISQNNEYLYWAGYGARFVHIALLGDPSLRMEYLKPASALTIDTLDTFHVELNWSASSETQIDGYFVFRSYDGGAFEPLNEQPESTTQFIDSCVSNHGVYTYLVKAVRLTESYSGSYWQESLGTSASIEIHTDKQPDGNGEFRENTGSEPLTGKFIAFDLNEWVSAVEWQAEGNVYSGLEVEYQPAAVFGSNFYYTVDFKNQCATKSLDKSIPMNVELAEKREGFKLFPNPAHEGQLLQIQSSEPIQSYQLIDASGRTILSKSGSNQIQLPAKISAGIYVIRVESESHVSEQKLIIQ